MGGHYGSIHVRTEDREAIRKTLEQIVHERDLKCLLGPALDGWISIYPNDSASDVAAALARAVRQPVLLTTVYDDDLFAYAYYEAGKLLDEYSSDPDCFEEVSAQERERLRGKPEVFRPLLNSDRKLSELSELLRDDGSESAHRFVFESERLERFASLFGIRNAVTSYDYLMEPERDGIKGWKQFLHIPDRTPEISARRTAATALRAARKRLQQQGLLWAECLPPDKSRHKLSWRADIYNDGSNPGFLIRWWKQGGYPPREPQVFRLEPPWPSEPKPVPIEVLAHESLQAAGFLFRERNGVLDQVSFATGELLRSIHLPAGCGPIWSIHPTAHFAVTRPRQDQVAIVNLESAKLEKALFCGTVTDWSRVADVFENTFLQAGLSHRELAQWKGSFVGGSEQVLRCRFSPDGKLLLCGMTTGLRIFDWERVLAATEKMPKPLFSVLPDPEPSGPERDYANYVYDLVFDESRNRVLFGGSDGQVHFLEVGDSRHGTLLDPPGRMAIIGFKLSSNREAVCCLCSPGRDDDQPWRVQVWNYRDLANLAGLGW